MDKRQLLKIIAALTEADFARLIFYLDVPYGTVPSAQQPQTQRAIALLQWANSPTGCSLQKVVEELKEMRAIAQEDELKITPPNIKTEIPAIVLGEEEAKINPPKAENKTNNHQSFTEKLPNNIDLEMVAIPAGSFMMGSNEYKTEQPVHKVTFARGFFMGKYPITQAQYVAVMRKNPSYFKGENNPVECVSWNDAQEFCQKLSAQTGKKYKLPSESQWEYACRAGSKTRYCFGDNVNQLSEYAWYDYNSSDKTHPVGQKKPNGWGLYDMHGNVWEYCEDDWHYDYKNVPDDGTSWVDKSSEFVVLRGGSWYYLTINCRSANRYYIRRDNDFKIYGFRVVCDSGRTL